MSDNNNSFPGDWYRAVDHQLNLIESTANSYPSPEAAVDALIDWHIQVSTDPALRQPVDDQINSPAHYTSSPAQCACGKPIECIQIAEHMNFNLGCALKYIWRCDLKDSAIDDLKKAAWYINREIAKREAI